MRLRCLQATWQVYIQHNCPGEFICRRNIANCYILRTSVCRWFDINCFERSTLNCSAVIIVMYSRQWGRGSKFIYRRQSKYEARQTKLAWKARHWKKQIIIINYPRINANKNTLSKPQIVLVVIHNILRCQFFVCKLDSIWFLCHEILSAVAL